MHAAKLEYVGTKAEAESEGEGMSEQRTQLDARQLQMLKDQAEKHPDCVTCQRHLAEGNYFSPRHEPMEACRSGKRPHCTCSYCF